MNRSIFRLNPSRNQLQSAVQFSSISGSQMFAGTSRRVVSKRLHQYEPNCIKLHQVRTNSFAAHRISSICSATTFDSKDRNISTNDKPPFLSTMLNSSSFTASSTSLQNVLQIMNSTTLSLRPTRHFYSTTTRSQSSIISDISKQQTSIPSNSTQSNSSLNTSRTKSTNTNDGAMDDEYGNMEASGKIYTHPQPYHLESFGLFGHHVVPGHPHHHPTALHSSSPLPRGVLNPAFINYNTYGTLNSARDNVLVICHALTGNSSLEAWWGELLGPGKAFDTDRYFVVCCNILGSCYGSCGPSSSRPGMEDVNDDDASVPRNKEGQAIYGIDFPDVSVRDTVRLQLLMLKNELNINSIKCVIGGSFGGMQTMEYCVMAGATRPDMGQSRMMMGCSGAIMMVNNNRNDPPAAVPYGLGEFTTRRNGRIEPFVRSAVPIACGARHTAWQIAISETQRQAVYADPKWNHGRIDAHDPPHSGLSVARQIGMVSYRTPLGYQQKFGRALTDESGPSYGSRAPWQVKSYLEYQGKKFLDRFDPVTYVKLTEQMDSHDVSRGRGTMEDVLSHVEIPVCVLGIDSDVLYPLHEQEEIAKLLPNGELKIIHSDAGHDGFLLEQDQVAAHIKSFLYSHE